MNLRDELITALINAKIPSPRLEADIIIKNVAPQYPDINKQQEEIDELRKMIEELKKGEK